MSNIVKDPVCGMEFDPKSAVAKVERNGKTYYFCSHACHAKFTSDPAQYTN